jgi:hypothetical protein
MGKMIGSGSFKDGLYYLDSQLDTPVWLIQAYHTIRADDSTTRIWLWHQRLGHPSFLVLQRMFPVLFLHNNVSKFQCETCELLNTIVCLFLLVSIKVMHLLFLFILMCGVLRKWFFYLVIGGLFLLLMIFLGPHGSTC